MLTSPIPPMGANWHMLAFNLTASGTAGYQALQAAIDNVFTVKGTNFQNPYNAAAFAAYCQSTNLIRARINTPSLRLRGFPQIVPFVNAAIVPDNAAVMDLHDHPIYLRPDEDIEIDADPGANADVVTAFLWLVMGNASYPTLNANVNGRDLRWVRYTSSITTVANTWTLGTITLEDTLEGGSYDVYGATCWGATMIGFRLLFQNQYWRPGTLAATAPSKRLPIPWLEQRQGLWGNFNTYSLPQIEVFNSAAVAPAAITGDMLIAKSSDQFRGMSM